MTIAKAFHNPSLHASFSCQIC